MLKNSSYLKNTCLAMKTKAKPVEDVCSVFLFKKCMCKHENKSLAVEDVCSVFFYLKNACVAMKTKAKPV